MEIVCDNCYTKLSVPDDKIPEGQRVGIKCPKCQNKVIVDLSSKAGADNTLDIDEFNGSTENTKEFGIDEEMEDLDLEFYGKDKKLALVLDSDLQRRQLITEIVSDLGYRPLAEEDSRKAFKRIRQYPVELLFLSDGFDNVPVDQSPVMAHISSLAMSARRRIFLVLVGERFRTMDRMGAFVMSANLLVNENDLDKLSPVLSMSITDKEGFYKVFIDTLKDIGRA